MEARQFARRYDEAKLDFKEKTFSGGDLTRSGPMEKKQEWKRSLSSHGLSSDQMHSAKSPKGIARIFSFVFLWPAHLLDTVFGTLMSEVPSLISKLFGGFLDKVSAAATGSRGGMPD